MEEFSEFKAPNMRALHNILNMTEYALPEF